MNRLNWRLAVGMYSEAVAFLALLLLLVLFGIVMGGCATPPDIYYDENGNITGGSTTYGFLRTLKIHQKKANGDEIYIETGSNTGEALGAVNSLLGTGVGAARDLMP